MTFPRWLVHFLFPIGSGAKDGPLTDVTARYLWTIPVVAAMGLATSLLEGMGIGLLVPLMYVSLSGELPASVPLPVRPLVSFAKSFDPEMRLAGVGLAILALVALKTIISVVNARFVTAIEGRVGADLRGRLADRLLRVGYPFFVKHDAARLVNIVATDSWRAIDGVRLIFAIAMSAAAILVFGTILLLIEWRLFLFVGLGVGLLRAGYVLYGRSLQRRSDRVSSSNRSLAERMLNLVTSIRLIYLFGQEKRELARFNEASGEVREAMYAIDSATASVTPVFELALATLFIAVLLLASRLSIPLPIVATFLVLLYRMQPQLMALNHARVGLAAIQGSTREVEWLLARPDEARPPVAATQPLREGSIRFQDVSFAFDSADRPENALKQASFEIPSGQTTALIGRSGAGKTTVVNLLTRLFVPSSGRIMVGATDLNDLDPNQWRRHVALAGQDLDLVEGSIADNIAYGCEDLDDAAIVEAARLADAHDFIAQLPSGYETRVGQRGLTLSGGQRQRIGLARALARRPDLLILDEATNAVDGISEGIIMRLLQEHRCFHTAIVISHRRSTLSSCQNGIVFERGRVIESGRLQDLAFLRHMEVDPTAEPAATVTS